MEKRNSRHRRVQASAVAGGHGRKILSVLGITILSIGLYFAYKSATFAQTTATPAPADNCVNSDYNGYFNPTGCHKKKVFYPSPSGYQTANCGNAPWCSWRVHCPSGSSPQSHSRAHFSTSPSSDGLYDGSPGGGGHFYCKDANGNELDPLLGDSDSTPYHLHATAGLIKVQVVDTNQAYYFGHNGLGWVECSGGVTGPYPQEGALNISTSNFPNHFHCKNANQNLTDSDINNDNPEAAPTSVATQPSNDLVGWSFASTADFTTVAKDQFVDKALGQTTPLGTVRCVSTASDKIYFSTTSTCPAASQFPVRSCSSLTLTLSGNKTSYTGSEMVNYTYTCSPAGTRAQSVTVQVVKPDGTATTYVNGTNIDTASMGFSVSNLSAGNYTLRACLNSETCAAGSVYSVPFTVTAATTTTTTTTTTTAGTSTNTTSNWVKHRWTFSDGTDESWILNRTDREYLDYVAGVDAQCSRIAKSRFSWKPGPGDDSAANWRNFGIAECSGTTTTVDTTTPPNTSCGNGEKCAKGSNCQNGMTCYYQDAQITCAAWPPPSAVAMPSQASCPAGTSQCNPTDTNCTAPGQIVPYDSAKWCNGGMKYYSTDGKNLTCVKWGDSAPANYSSCRPGDATCITENGYGSSTGSCSVGMKCYQKATDSNANNDAYCTPMPMPTATTMPADSVSCPSGYTLCSPTDTLCKQKGETWTDNASYNCMNSQKCTNATSGGSCVGWNDVCPSGTKYCSVNDTNCVEPEAYKALGSGSTSSYWCGGGGGMPYYTATQVYCPAKKAGSTMMAGMRTAAEILEILTKLGPGWGLCRPGDTNCIEPGKTGSSTGWCAWYPPNQYMPPMTSSGTSRTCPALDATSPEKKICIAITPVQCPAGQIQKSGTDANGCATSFCANAPEFRECGVGEIPGQNNSCMMPMYRWNIAAKSFEKCDRSNVQPYTSMYMSVKDNPKAQYTSCESFNYEIEKEWRTERFLAHSPQVDGEWYMPPWDAASKQLQYDIETDQFGECKAKTQFPYVATKPGVPMSFMAPCMPIPEADKGWLLKKSRAEYRMYQLYSNKTTNPTVPPVKPGEPPVPPTPVPLPLPPTPVIPVAQCKSYVTGLRQNVGNDKLFWKNVRVQLSQVPQNYPDLKTVSKLLDDSKNVIVEIENLVRLGKCDSDTLAAIQTKTNSLHSDLFAEISSYLPDVQDFVQYEQCRSDLSSRAESLKKLVKAAGDGESQKVASDLKTSIDGKVKEFEGRQAKGDYEVTFECREFMREIEPQINPILLQGDKELSRIVDDVVSQKLEPVLAELTKQLEERGKKIDDLLIQVAQLHKSIEAISNTASQISEKIAVSYSALSRIDEKFQEQKTQIQAAKDQLIPLIEKATSAMKVNACVRVADREHFIAELGNVATVNWVGVRADEIEKRLNLFIASCNAKQVNPEDVTAFAKSADELAVQNQQDSYKQGMTPFADVPTHEWYYGAMVAANKVGAMTQGRPGENVLRQDALLMMLRAVGEKDTDITGTCALKAPSATRVSSYAICAVNLAYTKGLDVSGPLDRTVSRVEVAKWLAQLANLSAGANAASLDSYSDLRGLDAEEQSAVQAVVDNQIMVGNVSSGSKSTFIPQAPLTRAALAVILEKLLAVSPTSSSPK